MLYVASKNWESYGCLIPKLPPDYSEPVRFAWVPRFDCESGYMNWVHGWSPGKKIWCCRHTDRGCPPTTITRTTTRTGHVEVGDATQGSDGQVRSHRSSRPSTRYLNECLIPDLAIYQLYGTYAVYIYIQIQIIHATIWQEILN